MPKSKYTPEQFKAICEEHNYSPTAVSKATGLAIRNVQMRMDRLDIIRDHTDYAKTIQRYGGHIENLDYEGDILVFTDAHFWPTKYTPLSDAFLIFLQIAKHLNPKLIVDGGDSFDGYSLSRFPKHGWHDGPSVVEELKAVQECKKAIEQAAPRADYRWVWGNHDARFDSKLANQADQFRDVEGFRLPDHFKKWQFSQSLVINKALKFVHFWRGGEHAAFNDTMRSGINYCSGHDHQLYVRAYCDENGVRFGIKAGTLADPNGPQFFYCNGNKGNNWVPGMVVIHVKGKDIYPEPIYVINGEARWAGKVWSAKGSSR